MATRVNTRFVFVLAAVLICLVGGLVGLYYFAVMRSPEERVRRGDILLAQGDQRGALEHYGRALAKQRDNLLLIDKYEGLISTIVVKDHVEAQRFLGEMRELKRSAADLNPQDAQRAQAYFGFIADLAEKFGGTGWWDQLYTVANNKLQQYPDDALAKRYRGIANVHLLNPEIPLPRFDEAEADLLEAYQRDEKDAEVAHHLALYFLREADRLQRVSATPEAIADLRNKAVEISARSLAVAPQEPERQVNHVQILLSPSVNRVDEARPIVEGLEAQLLKDPQPESAVVALVDALPRTTQGGGDAVAQAKGGVERSQRLLQAASEKSPDNVLYRLMLGRALTMTGDTDGAIAQYAKAWELGANKSAIDALRSYELRLTAALQQMSLELAQADGLQDPKAREEKLAAIEKRLAELQPMTGEGAPTNLLRGKLALARRQFRVAMQHLDLASQQYGHRNLEALLLAARACRLAGERGAAADRLKQALELNPGLPGVRAELAELHLELQQPDLAQAQIDLALAQNPEDAQVKSLQARLLGTQGKFDQSLEAFQQLDPATNPQIVEPMAQLLLRAGREDEARELLRKRFEQAPTDLRAMALLFDLTEGAEAKQAMIGKAREAGANETVLGLMEQRVTGGDQPISQQQVLEEVLAKQEDPVQRLLGQTLLYRQTGETEKAKQAFEEAQKLAPDNGQVIEMRFTDALQAKDWATAEAMATKAGAQNLDLAQGAFFRARLAAAREQLEESIAEYRKGLSGVGVFSDGWRQLGEVQMRSKDTAGAAESFRKALEQRPDNARAMRGLAAVADAQGDHARALQLLRDARRFAPNDGELFNVYLAYEQQHGDPKRALEIRQQLAAQNPRNGDNRRALALLLAGQNQRDQAIEAMEKLVADEGLTRGNVNTLASIYGMAGDAAKGRETIEEYLRTRGEAADAEDLLLLARFHLASGNFDAAIDGYTRARAKEDPAQRPVTRELADLLFAAGRNEQAVSLYRELHQASPDDKVVALRFAEALMRAQQIDEAQAIVAKNPDTSQAQVLRAILLLQGGDAAGAREALERAVQLDPTNTLARVQLANLLGGDPATRSRARDLLTQTLRDDPNSSEARVAMAQLHQRAGETREAMREYRTELDRNPENVNVRVGLVDLYMASGDAGGALALLEEAQKLQPEDPTWPRLMARVETARNNFAAAIPHAQKQHELAPSAESLMQLATLQIRAERPKDALDALAKQPDVVNSEPALQGLRGWALAKNGQADEARQVFDRAFERASNPPQAQAIANYMVQSYGLSETISRLAALPAAQDSVWMQLTLADLEVQNKQYADAVARLDAIQPALGDQPEPVRAAHLRLHGLALYQARDLQRARDVFRKMLEIEPDDVGTLNNLAYLLVEDLNLASEGLPLAERAAELMPDGPQKSQVLDTLGWAQFKVGRVDDARRTLESSLELQPLAPSALHLAQVHLKLGSAAQARSFAQQAVTLAEQSGDQEVLRQAKELLTQIDGQAAGTTNAN